MLCSFCLHAKGLQFTATLNLEQYRWAGVKSLQKGFRFLSDDWSIDHLVLPCTFCVARSTKTTSIVECTRLPEKYPSSIDFMRFRCRRLSGRSARGHECWLSSLE
ncbi:hypothetical protein F2Q69_00031674 [Brassica cretica]|uniref:Uncharacterized protein n=1 Tax=Brassica cretica TaxID=69181 RepID=A0A8S9RV90_BRACR|nr:hypothetical protein F2Q69_00031674 [Brassica cretica]